MVYCETGILLKPKPSLLKRKHFFILAGHALCLHFCTLHRITMAEKQEEMSPVEMKVARQIEVTVIIKLIPVIS